MLFGYTLPQILYRLVAVFLAVSVHEMAHALAAYWLGDTTARQAGRLSLNPFAHIDWIGLLCLLLFGFGWAKPVPINPNHYKHEKTGIIWTSFAGPLANFILSFVCILLVFMMAKWVPAFFLSSVGQILYNVFLTTASLSLGFGVFNLIPIPPLDGAKIFWSFLPDRIYYKYMNGSIWMTLILLALIYTGILSGPLSSLLSAIYSGMWNAAAFLFGM